MTTRRSGGQQGSVRIIGGRWRGRRLCVAPGEQNRPTPDRVRETLFNWLAPHIEGLRCLDLFAGSGSLGIEALSRGAAEVHFVEHQPETRRHLKEILQVLECDCCKVLSQDALKYLQTTPIAFDLVFLDPPFDGTDRENLCTLIQRGWLAPGGFIYFEMNRRSDLPELPAGWELLREKTAGQVRFALVRNLPEGHVRS